MTIAEKIAKRFNNDGSCWIDENRIRLVSACQEAPCAGSFPDRGVALYEFQDGSAIVTRGEFWAVRDKNCKAACFEGKCGCDKPKIVQIATCQANSSEDYHTIIALRSDGTLWSGLFDDDGEMHKVGGKFWSKLPLPEEE